MISCPNCGSSSKDDSVTCSVCGFSFNSEPQGVNTDRSRVRPLIQEQTKQVKTVRKNETDNFPANNNMSEYSPDLGVTSAKYSFSGKQKAIFIALTAVLILAVIGIILKLTVFTHKPPKGHGDSDKAEYTAILDDLKKVFCEGDEALLESLILHYSQDASYGSQSVTANKIADNLEDKYGAEVLASYSIKSARKIESEELEKIEKRYDGSYSIEKGYTLFVEFSFDGDDSSGEEYVRINVYKCGGRWYADQNSLYSLSKTY